MAGRAIGVGVAFKQLEPAEIEAYLESGEGVGKAGGYAIQGCAAALIRAMSGSYSGVVGLPLFETRALLRTAGYPLGCVADRAWHRRDARCPDRAWANPRSNCRAGRSRFSGRVLPRRAADGNPR